MKDLIIERRTLVEPVEFRSEGTTLVASGVAIRYGAVSKDLGGFKERIMPGAATKTLKERDVTMLHEHERRMLLGRSSAGTLRITNNRDEMAYEVDLPDTSYGRDLAVSLERRDVTGSSFGFLAIGADTKWSVDEDGAALRSVGALMLDHLSTTCAPAYDENTAELAMRSLAASSGQEFRTLLEAAARGELPELIAPPESGDDEPEAEDEEPAGEPPVHRRPAEWFV